MTAYGGARFVNMHFVRIKFYKVSSSIIPPYLYFQALMLSPFISGRGEDDTDRSSVSIIIRGYADPYSSFEYAYKSPTNVLIFMLLSGNGSIL